MSTNYQRRCSQLYRPIATALQYIDNDIGIVPHNTKTKIDELFINMCILQMCNLPSLDFNCDTLRY